MPARASGRPRRGRRGRSCSSSVWVVLVVQEHGDNAEQEQEQEQGHRDTETQRHTQAAAALGGEEVVEERSGVEICGERRRWESMATLCRRRKRGGRGSRRNINEREACPGDWDVSN